MVYVNCEGDWECLRARRLMSGLESWAGEECCVGECECFIDDGMGKKELNWVWSELVKMKIVGCRKEELG
jgi:hypothetical protein